MRVFSRRQFLTTRFNTKRPVEGGQLSRGPGILRVQIRERPPDRRESLGVEERIEVAEPALNVALQRVAFSELPSLRILAVGPTN